MNIRLRHALLPLAMLLAACGSDPYDTGEGSLSQMRADFVEAHTDANACMTSVETDGGERLTLTPPVALEWAAKPDTTYRALLYYNKTADANGTLTAEPIAMQQVLVPQIVTAEDIEGGMKTDPVEFISAWKSVNGKYLNLEIAVKTGTNDGTYNAQTIGVTCDGVTENADGTRHISLTLYHDQGDAPEYYSAETYVSVAITRLPVTPAVGDEVSISLNTYDGVVTRTFTL